MKYIRALFHLLAIALVAGCAGSAARHDAVPAPDGKNAIIYGRAQLLHNSQLIVYGDQKNIEQAAIVNHVSAFTSIDDLKANAAAPGKWAIVAPVSDYGYFAAQLPPGRYYFAEFEYVNQLPGLTTTRSYTDNPPSISFRHRFVATFEVEAGKATYIGEVDHLLADIGPGAVWSWGVKISDDSERANVWLKDRYPQWAPYATTKMIQMAPVR